MCKEAFVDKVVKMIKGILLDLDDTLFNTTFVANESRINGLKTMKKHGLQIDIGNAKNMLDSIVKKYGSNYGKHFNEFLSELKTQNPNSYGTINIAKYVACGVVGYHNTKIDNLKPYDDVLPFLNRFKEKGYCICVISDGIAIKQYEKLIRLGILDIFDRIFISEETELEKPNPEIFKHCLNQIDLKGEETLYIGDRLDKDIKPANEVNINTVLIHRRGKYDPKECITSKELSIKPDFEIESLDEIGKILSILNTKNEK